MYLFSSVKNVHIIHVQPELALSVSYTSLFCVCALARVRDREILLLLHSGTLRLGLHVESCVLTSPSS